MPKIIKDLEDKIFTAAMDLFGEFGYKEVDMKKIAKKVGIAVGTLYNYYSNKEELFLGVFEKSWQGTLDRLQIIVQSDVEGKAKLIEFFSVLNDEIKKRKGLGKEMNMLNDDMNHLKHPWNKIHVALRSHVRCILEYIGDEHKVVLDEEKMKRLVDMLLLTNFSFNIHDYRDATENKAYWEWLLDTLYSNSKPE